MMQGMEAQIASFRRLADDARAHAAFAHREVRSEWLRAAATWDGLAKQYEHVTELLDTIS
jgi:hypothetical protein